MTAPKDVDLENSVIQVRNAIVVLKGDEYPNEKNRLRLKATKTDSSERDISIDAKTVAALTRYKEDQYFTLAYFGESQDEETPVVCDKLGRWYHPDQFTKDFEAFRAQHGFGIRLHDLRHTQATILLQRNMPITTVSRRLGHSKVSTTLDVYSHVLPGQDEEAAKAIGGLFFDETA